MSFYGVKLHRSDILQLDEHPNTCDETTFGPWCRKQARSRARLAVDLFSGAGGLSLGLQQAGWTVAASVDSDQRSLETHRANFGGLALQADLGTPEGRDRVVDLLDSASIDLIAGGPPCQPFSRAGRSKIRSLVQQGVRDPNDLREELWRAFLDVVLRVEPRAVLMENVPDMALGDDFRVVRTVIDELELAGYFTQVRLVDAWRYGVPQHRKRLIILARRDREYFDWSDTDDFPGVYLRDAIGDLPRLPESGDEAVGGRQLRYKAPRKLSEFALSMRCDVPEPGVIHDHMTRPVRPDDYEIFQNMTHQTLYSDVPEHLRRYRADSFDDKYKRLNWDDYSRSVTAHIAKDGYWYIHPEQHRTLTVREAARIQTFPDRFRFSGSRSDAYRQIGNAVPPLLGQAASAALAPSQVSAGESNTWLELHRALSRWAKTQKKKRAWFLYPGPDVRQAAALVVTLIGPQRIESNNLAPVLNPLRHRPKLVLKELDRLRASVGDSRLRQRLDPIEKVTTGQKVWQDTDELAAAIGLKPAERSVFNLLLGDDVMITTQNALRVAARVCGTDNHRKNRLTDGRVDLARLIGGGDDAPLRMAALRDLGSTRCLPDKPVCLGCPLEDWCKYAETRDGDGTLY